jgi:hypothetical protein
MDLLQSKLAKRHSELAQEIQGLLIEAQKFGAHAGVQRMEFICDQYDNVLPDIAYNWIDLNAFQNEIEESLSETLTSELIRLIRNVLLLSPLIITWFALFVATNAYQQDITLHPTDSSTPFLLLWQNGFHGLTWLTFSVVAGLDTLLLLILLILFFLAQGLDRRARSSAVKLIGKVRVAVGKLVEAIITDSHVLFPYGHYVPHQRKEARKEKDILDEEEIMDNKDLSGRYSHLTLNRASTLRIRIMEDPLTALNFNMIISALTELHTKCWLIQQGRFSDLIDYAQTRSTHLAREAGLVITKLTLNSPADIELAQATLSGGSAKNMPVDIKVNVDASPKGVMEALRTAIDAVIQVPLRFRLAQLEIRAKEAEMHYKEVEGQSQLADKEQNRQLEAQNAELVKQKTLLEIEREKVEIERQRLVLQSERLELEKTRLEYALETANEMIDALHPGIDIVTKAILARTLLPNLLQLGSGHGLELSLPAPEDTQSAEDK